MADRPFVNQVVQIGAESVAGTPVNATKRLQSLRLVPAVEDTVTKVTPMGFIYPTIVAEGQEWTSLDATGVGTYTELQYVMSAIFGKVSGGTPTALGSGAYRWINQGGITSIDDAQTYSVEIGDSNIAEKVSNALFTDWDMTLTRKAVDIKGKMIANLLTTGSTLSASHPQDEIQQLTFTGPPSSGSFKLTFSAQQTPAITWSGAGPTALAIQAALVALSSVGVDTNDEPNVNVSGTRGGPYLIEFVHDLGSATQALITIDNALLVGGTGAITEVQAGSATAPVADITVVPILPKEGNIYLDTAFGSIGTTQLRRDFQVTIGLTAKSGPIWPIDRSQTSYAAVVGLQPKSSIKLQIMADSAGLGPLAYLRSGQTVYIRLNYLSASIAGGSTHFEWTMDISAKVESIGKFGDMEGVYVLDYTLQPVADPSSGFAFKSNLVNNQSAL